MEPLTESPTFLSRPMFGCVACYVDGRFVALLADRREPWRGLVLPMERSRHASVLEEFPDVAVHPRLGKWLYVPQASARFATAAREIIRRIADGDPRFGVEAAIGRLPVRRPAVRR